MRIYFDMDGTIANLYKGEWLEDIINENARPYEIADRMVEEEFLQELVNQGHELAIISWLAKNGSKEYNAKVRLAKKEWLRKNYPNIHFVEMHIVKYGYRKDYVAKVKNGILVDDEEPNRKNWKGQAYHPNDFFK